MKSYRACGHCDKYLSDKAYKEHYRLYFQQGRWLRADDLHLCESSQSSPLSVSDPNSDVESQPSDNDLEEADILPEDSDDMFSDPEASESDWLGGNGKPS